MISAITMLENSFLSFGIWDALDILIMSVLIYYVLKLTSRSRAKQILQGFGVLLAALILSGLFQFQTVSWLLNYILTSGIIILVVLFQPEVRRMLEQLGRNKLLQATRDLLAPEGKDTPHPEVVDEIAVGMQNMAKTKTGCLIVVEHSVPLDDIIETGTAINARITSQLLENIFVPNTPLHDGAVVIRSGKIAAAGCFLPLSHNNDIPKELGTRHRAALGMSENADCTVLLVSEETGVISMARGGEFERYLDAKGLRTILEGMFLPQQRATALGKRIRRARHEK